MDSGLSVRAGIGAGFGMHFKLVGLYLEGVSLDKLFAVSRK